MENLYLVIIVILLALALSDLMVGVSNDAVNFLNSAIGSKAAPRWIIFLVAAFGVFIGSMFSSGMMEVARKGIFHPEMFVFSEIIILFLAVMITDVLLLDAFNTLGLPTSTTVSLVFELMGSAVAVSLVKIHQMGGSFIELGSYINSAKALAIITGILVSVIIAFTAGSLIMFLARFIFTFHFKKTLKYYGSLFGGFAISVILYFMLIKGIDGSSFAEIKIGSSGLILSDWVSANTGLILLVNFAVFTILLQVLFWLFKIDILRVVVLAGTFALAMAFAANDLVNFIGVPVAGFKSYQAWVASGVPADQFSMEFLRGKVETPYLFLLVAGVVMIVTLVTSKKARAVTETEVNLGRQTEGVERFGSSLMARVVVRNSLRLNKKIIKFLPEVVTRTIKKRFLPVVRSRTIDLNEPAFDKIRASINLIVASILIAFGTSLKLPLSTTYVTFMVAMGSSLSDKAWDRESAVYRISGVFAVIGGWFLTAIIAFTVAALIAWIISIGGMVMIFVFLAIAILIFIRSHILFKRRSKKAFDDDDSNQEREQLEIVSEKCYKQVVSTIISSNKVFSLSIDSFLAEDRAHLKEALLMKDELDKKTKKQKNKILNTISKLKREEIDSGHFYVQVVNYQREVAHTLNFITTPMMEHLENQHKPLASSQEAELRVLIVEIDEFYNFALHIVKEEKFESIEELIAKKAHIMGILQEFEKIQIKRIKNQEVNTRNSVLYFNILTETKNMLLHAVNMVKSHSDFIIINRKTV